MFVQVAHYKLGRGSVQELRPRVASGPPEVMKIVPGFIDYYAFDAGNGVVASVAVFEDEAGLREAEEKLEGWVAETIEMFHISPEHLSEGTTFASTTQV